MAPERETTTLQYAELAELRHNLRAAVNQVLGYTEMFIEEAADTRNPRALDALRHAHSSGLAALTDINEALGQQETVVSNELDALRDRIQPRVDRIAHSIAALRAGAEADSLPDWAEDLQRVDTAARTVVSLLGGAVGPSLMVTEPAPAAEATGPSVLVVDDNATNRYLLKRRLERQGYRAAEARNGSEALDRIATESFDLVLLDTRMPVMDGFEVLDRMKKDRRMRSTPVVMISAVDESESAVRAIEMGADDYLVKPFEAALLRARVGALMERQRLADELAAIKRLAQEIARLSAELFSDAQQLLLRIDAESEPAAELRVLARNIAQINQHASTACAGGDAAD